VADVNILKIFTEKKIGEKIGAKNGRNNGRFFQTAAVFEKIGSWHWFLSKTPIFCRKLVKSLKIVTVTMTPSG
jgi:hypothetical protein